MMKCQPLWLSLMSPNKTIGNHGQKYTFYFGQPVHGQLIQSFNHDKIVEMSLKKRP